LEIPYALAILGGEITVPTPYGAERVKIPKKTKEGQLLRLQRKGIITRHMQGGNFYGNMDTMDFLTYRQLQAWLDKLYPYDWEKEEHLFGDPIIAYAAFIDSTSGDKEDFDRPPVNLYKAIMIANKIEDPEELDRRINERDPSLVMDYETLEPFIRDVDIYFWCDLLDIQHKYVDHFAYHGNYETEKVEKLWKEARDAVSRDRELRQQIQDIEKTRTKQETSATGISPIKPYEGWEYVKK